VTFFSFSSPSLQVQQGLRTLIINPTSERSFPYLFVPRRPLGSECPFGNSPVPLLFSSLQTFAALGSPKWSAVLSELSLYFRFLLHRRCEMRPSTLVRFPPLHNNRFSFNCFLVSVFFLRNYALSPECSFSSRLS